MELEPLCSVSIVLHRTPRSRARHAKTRRNPSHAQSTCRRHDTGIMSMRNCRQESAPRCPAEGARRHAQPMPATRRVDGSSQRAVSTPPMVCTPALAHAWLRVRHAVAPRCRIRSVMRRLVPSVTSQTVSRGSAPPRSTPVLGHGWEYGE
jgi:hypothetical protein